MENEWGRIKNYLLQHDDCKDVHKLIHSEFAVLTTFHRGQHRIMKDATFQEAKNIVQFVKSINERRYEPEEK